VHRSCMGVMVGERFRATARLGDSQNRSSPSWALPLAAQSARPVVIRGVRGRGYGTVPVVGLCSTHRVLTPQLRKRAWR